MGAPASRRLVAGLLAILLGAVLIGPLPVQAHDEPEAGDRPLRVSPAAVDLGEVPAGEAVDFEIVVHNAATDPVRLRYIHAECDCTLQLPASGMVPASGQLALAVTLLPQEDKRGFLAETITILTDLAAQSELIIPVQVWIRPGDGQPPDIAQRRYR